MNLLIRFYVLVCVLNLSIFSDIYSQNAVLELDINNNGSSNPRNFINISDGFIFIATNSTLTGTKQEIWRFKNGIYSVIYTATGNIFKLSIIGSFLFFEDQYYSYPWTYIESINIFDLNTNQNHSFPNILVEQGQKYFYVRDGYFIFYSLGISGNRYIYKINLQTFILSKIDSNPIEIFNSYGIFSIYSDTFIEYKNFTIFSAYTSDGSSNAELFKIDGITGSKVLLKDINVGLNSSYPFYFNVANDLLFFVADNGINGRELWVTNGEAAETFLIKDINIGISNSNFLYFEVHDNLLYFIVLNSGIYELWSTDGTTIGTIKILDNTEAFNRFTFYSNYIILYTANGNCPLWKYDKTTQTKFRITAFNRFLEPVYIIDNLMFFRAENLDWVIRDHFFVYNVDTNQTYWLNTDNQNRIYHKPESIFKDGAFLYYSAIDPYNNRRELFRTDGSIQGTRKYYLNNIYASNPSNFLRYNENIFFSGYSDAIIKQELCRIPLIFCKNNENIVNNIDIPTSKKVNKSIQANSSILGNINVTFDAGKSIILNPGFSTNNGVNFKASINECGSN